MESAWSTLALRLTLWQVGGAWKLDGSGQGRGRWGRYRRHDCGEDWETGDAGVSGAGRAQGTVPALSGWERLRVTISLMRADRPAGRESCARPDPRTLLCRVCGESGRICGGAETRGSLAWVAKKQCCLPRRGCPGGAQETPPGRTLGPQRNATRLVNVSFDFDYLTWRGIWQRQVEITRG